MNDNLAYQDERREELIGGKVVMMSPASSNHNRIAENIDFLFRTYLKGKACVPLGDGYSLHLTEKDRFVPDFMIVCDRSKIKPRGVYGTPDLVLEVLSPATAKNDRFYKKDVYEASGVPEYWLVDPLHRSIEVYLLQDGRYFCYRLRASPGGSRRRDRRQRRYLRGTRKGRTPHPGRERDPC